MLVSVEFKGARIDYRDSGAFIPLYTRQNNLVWLPWGLRRQDNHLHFHVGSTVTDLTVKSGAWDALKPLPVRLAVDRFTILDRYRRTHTFYVEDGTAMRGVLVSYRDERRVYVLTEPSMPQHKEMGAYWPKFRSLFGGRAVRYG